MLTKRFNIINTTRGNWFIFILLCSAFVTQAQLPPLIPYRKGKKWGASDSTKKIIIPAIYEDVRYLGKYLVNATDYGRNGEPHKCTLYDLKGKVIGFYNNAEIGNDGYVHVLQGDDKIQYHGLLSLTGEVIIPVSYRWIDAIHEGLMAVSNGNKQGFINLKGEVVIPLKYEYVMNFANGRAWVNTNINKVYRVGSVDKDGNEIWLDGYETVTNLEPNSANVSTKDKIGVVNKLGEFIVPLHDNKVDNRSVQVSTTTTRKKYAVKLNGKILTEEKYDEVLPNSSGYFKVEIAYYSGLVDSTGKEIIPPKYEVVGQVQDGIALVSYGGKYGFYDVFGHKTPLNYDEIRPFKHGVAEVRVGKKWGFINKKGKLIVPVKYDQVNVFDYGTYVNICVQIGEDHGLIDKQGEEITPMYYSSCPQFSGNYIVAQCGKKSGVLREDESVVILFRYDEIRLISSGRWFLKKDRKSFLADSTGTIKELMLPYKQVSLSRDGKFLMASLKDGRIHFLNPEGNKIINEFKKFPFHPFPGRNRVVEKTNGKYGVINPDGEMLISPVYDNLSQDVFIVPRNKDVNVLFWATNGQLSGLVDIHGTFYVED
jgi:hypothetical protein